MPSDNLPTESERNQAELAGKAQVQSEAERGEKKNQTREKTLTTPTDEGFGSNPCACFVYLTASLQGLIKHYGLWEVQVLWENKVMALIL